MTLIPRAGTVETRRGRWLFPDPRCSHALGDTTDNDIREPVGAGLRLSAHPMLPGQESTTSRDEDKLAREVLLEEASLCDVDLTERIGASYDRADRPESHRLEQRLEVVGRVHR